MTLIWIPNYGTTGKFEYKGEIEIFRNKQKILKLREVRLDKIYPVDSL